nr:MAG: hypothetical protein DIU61_19595 [Bacteroidota bacterium]
MDCSSITGITVNYETPKLLVMALSSIHRFYPDLKIVVVNLSLFPWKGKIRNVEFHNLGQNIGHGPGMHYGLMRTKTDFALCFDTDIILKKPCLEQMLEQMTRGSYGVGQVINVDEKGRNSDRGTRYLHPHFMLLRVNQYFKYHRFVHHGAPCIRAMEDLKSKGKSYIVKDFPVSAYVYHKGRGTRRLQPREFTKNWHEKSAEPNPSDAALSNHA